MAATAKTSPPNGAAHIAELDASKLIVNLAETLKPIPEDAHFGEHKTDHMLVVSYEPTTGWSAPEIKPYGPFTLDPSSSCFQYCPNVFEGMKAYVGPNGEPRLFRSNKNMERLTRSAERVALPPFDEKELLVLIKRLVMIDKRWIPTKEGHSLYIRPTIIGTRTALGVAASDSALLYVFMTPTGPYFDSSAGGIPLQAVSKTVRSWPGGTGGHKLGLNYAPGFLPQRVAAKDGYVQILWLLPHEGEERITEAGAMNFFVVVKRDDGDLDVVTPPLDGTILPGITRLSCIELLQAHTEGRTVLPGIPATQRLYTHERPITMRELAAWTEEGKVVEAFGVGTAVAVLPIGRIGHEERDLVLPSQEGLGVVGKALLRRVLDIQTGRFEWEGWSEVCEV
ncbi:putative class-IV pyridoxal-phosphate-dependent aminotransferase family protein [Lyophyllum shimeji]|uniref:Branched-chain-amino-acid aminotransferase n=1 Tax=Lyophyllum shimeji TaxID=47721 RepID=A0A9P3PIY9_LYOSH|nr:putative class-IV pyridoxal-phosphate-dependent aminotransferase family protein [Lyophyllum shimeji]